MLFSYKTDNLASKQLNSELLDMQGIIHLRNLIFKAGVYISTKSDS